MKLTIDPTSTPANYGLSDPAPALEIYANEQFETDDGKTVLSGNVMLSDFRHRVVGEIVDGEIHFPAIVGIYSTEDSLTNQIATYSAYIKVKGREPILWFDRFRVPPLTRPEMTSTSWTRLRVHNRHPIARPSTDDWKNFVLASIEAAVGQQTKTGVAQMVDGEVEVPHTSVTFASRIAPFSMDEGVTGSLRAAVADIIPNDSFVIRSTNPGDNGTVAWIMI